MTEAVYAMALTRISNFNFTQALELYRTLGSATALYEHRNDIADVVDHCSPRLVEALRHWDEPLRRAEVEMKFIEKHGITVMTLSDDNYPQRLAECADAPIVLYYKGSANLNKAQIVNIVGTRHCTPYGSDSISRLVRELKELCPDVMIVSGLAYGVDIAAHRAALGNGLETVGVLAHGLDTLYPSRHRETAKAMLSLGGLLTEFMSGTNADKVNFVRRNRIVAGMSDATIVIESDIKGGSLITAGIARSYCRDVFALPGAVGWQYSQGCNRLIRDNGAALFTSAEDIVKAMGWEYGRQLSEARHNGIERCLFAELTEQQQKIASLLSQNNDLQLNIISVQSGLPIHVVTAELFAMEMQGVVRSLAGGMFHLISK